MNPKTFFGFALVTLVIVIAATASIASRYGAATSIDINEVVFSGMTDKLGSAGEISIQDKDKTLTIKKQGDAWVVSDRSNYKAVDNTVRAVLVGVSELRLREAKTEKAERYAALQVEDVTAKNANSRLLTVKDKDGKVMASLLVGKENNELAGGSDVGRYIRKPGEKRSWLAEGKLTVPNAVKNWVTPQFLHVASKRVDTVVVTQPNGQIMSVKRENPKSKKFLLQNTPPARKIEYQSDIDNMGDGLDKLELEDVMAAGKIAFPPLKTTSTKIKTYDGLVMDVQMLEKGENFWAVFKASTGDGANDDVKKEAENINAEVSKWVYQLPAFKFRYMSRKVEDVLEKPKKKDDKK